jgi:hypothetical protein
VDVPGRGPPLAVSRCTEAPEAGQMHEAGWRGAGSRKVEPEPPRGSARSAAAAPPCPPTPSRARRGPALFLGPRRALETTEARAPRFGKAGATPPA